MKPLMLYHDHQLKWLCLMSVTDKLENTLIEVQNEQRKDEEAHYIRLYLTIQNKLFKLLI